MCIIYVAADFLAFSDESAIHNMAMIYFGDVSNDNCIGIWKMKKVWMELIGKENEAINYTKMKYNNAENGIKMINIMQIMKQTFRAIVSYEYDTC